jgi:hypothetical protein
MAHPPRLRLTPDHDDVLPRAAVARATLATTLERLLGVPGVARDDLARLTAHLERHPVLGRHLAAARARFGEREPSPSPTAHRQHPVAQPKGLRA